MRVIMKRRVTTQSVFDDLGFDQALSEDLKIRAGLMNELLDYIEKNKLTQSEAAKLFHVSQPRISDLKRGKIERFTIDGLIKLLKRADQTIELRVNGKRLKTV